MSNLPSVLMCLLAALLSFLLHARKVLAEESPPPIFAAPIAVSHPCGPLGDCARFDAIGIHAGTIAATRFSGNRRFVGLSGWAHGSLTFLNLATIGGAIGGHYGRDEFGNEYTASSPAILFAKLRVYPWPWRLHSDGGLQIAASYQRTFVSDRLGKEEPPGFDLNTARLLASRSFNAVDLDAGVGASWGSSATDLRRYVEASFSAALRIHGLIKAQSADEQLRVMVQGLYRFALPESAAPSEGYVMFGVEERASSGYGFALSIGPQLLGAQVGGLFMMQFSVSWGLRYRNPWAESLAGKRTIPRFWMDLLYIDPILREDGCVYTEPSRGIAPVLLKCLGTPDPKNLGKVKLYTGGYVSTPLRLWADDDGTLIDQEGYHVGKIDKSQLPLALAAQELAKKLHEQEQATGQRCAYRADMLNGVHDLGLASVIAGDPMGGAAALFATELGRMIQCGDPSTLSGGGFLPLLGRLPLGKGPKTYRGPLLGRGAATPIGEVISDELRSHIFFGDVNKAKSTGWHYEPSGDPKKGTYVIEDTRSALDKNGVYEANVMIEGVKKGPRSTFFPKHWSEAEVEKAILEAYEKRQPTDFPGTYTGTVSNGVKIELRIDNRGKITTAYPMYKKGE